MQVFFCVRVRSLIHYECIIHTLITLDKSCGTYLSMQNTTCGLLMVLSVFGKFKRIFS